MNVSTVNGKTIVDTRDLSAVETGKPVRIKAIKGGQYLLAQGEQAYAPQNITAKRVGKDLHVALEGTSPDQPELIIEGFYEYDGQLVGMAEDATYYQYVTVEGDTDYSAPFLLDGAASPLALGGSQLIGFSDGLAVLAGGVSLTSLGLGALGLLGGGLALGNSKGNGDNNDQPLRDTSPSENPVIGAVLDDKGTVTGLVPDGGTTDDDTPTLSGTGLTPGNKVIISDHGKALGEVIVDSDGNWSFTPSPLNSGEHSFTVVAEDKAGNKGLASDAFVVTIDTTAPAAPSLDSVYDDQGDVQGNLTSGQVTDDSKPQLSGTAEAGSTVVIYDGKLEIGRAPVDAAGNWTFTPSTPLGNGAHKLSVTSVDAAGNASVNSNEFVLDVQAGEAPAAPAINAVKDDVGSVQGNLQKDAVTDDARPTVEGTAQAGSTISVYSNGKLLGTTVADNKGAWSFTPATDLAEGVNNLSATATNSAGNISPSTGLYPITVDTVAPGKATGDLDDNVGNIQGPIANGDVTDDNTPTFHGQAEGNATVIIYDNGTEIGRVPADKQGYWSFTPSKPLAEGPHSLNTAVLDPAGNLGEQSSVIDFTVDTSKVVVSIDTVMDNEGSITGQISKGGVTDDTTPTLNGKATANSTVNLYDNGVLIGSTTSNTAGIWSFTPVAPLAEGTHSLTATVTTAVNGESEPTTGFDLVIDTTAPSKASIDAISDDVGALQGPIVNGGFTDDTTPSLSGSAEAGSTVHVYDGANLLGSVLADSNDKWSFTPSPLNDGEHSFTVISQDKAGNQSAVSDSFVITVDTVAPTQAVTITRLGKDTGASATDFLTKDGEAGRLVQGKLSAVLGSDEALQISSDGGKTWTIALTNGMDWCAQDNNRHTSTWDIQWRVVDSAGNEGAVQSVLITLDADAPLAPAAVWVEGNTATVDLGATTLNVGDTINLAVHNQRIDYVLTASDIVLGSVKVDISNMNVTMSSQVSAAIVDTAGNSSSYTSAARFVERVVDFSSAPLDLVCPSWKCDGIQFSSTKPITVSNTYAGKYGTTDNALLILTEGFFSVTTFTLDAVAQSVSFNFGGLDVGAKAVVTFYDAQKNIVSQFTLAGNGPVGMGEYAHHLVSVAMPEAVIASFDIVTNDNVGYLIDDIKLGAYGETITVDLSNQTVVDSGGTYIGENQGTTFSLAETTSLNGSGASVHGGNGIDVLKLTGADQMLDLTELGSKVSSVEVIDITGTGDNTLKLSLADVLEQGAMDLFHTTSQHAVQMMVKGDDGDVVELSDLIGSLDVGDWAIQSQYTSGGVVYEVYQHSGMDVELLVQQGVTVHLV